MIDKPKLLSRIKKIKEDYCFEIVKQIEDKHLNWSSSIVKDKDGFFYLPAYLHNKILCYDKELNFVRSFGEAGSKPGQLAKPHRLVLLKDYLYVFELENNRIQIFSKKGESQKIYSLEKLFNNPVDKNVQLFTWKDKIGLLNIPSRFIGLFTSELEFIRQIEFPDIELTELYNLKEVDDLLMLPLINGETFIYDEESCTWKRHVRLSVDNINFKFISDIIENEEDKFIIDHQNNTIYKIRKGSRLISWKPLKNILLKGIIDDKYLYLICSPYNDKNKGNLLKIKIKKES